MNASPDKAAASAPPDAPEAAAAWDEPRLWNAGWGLGLLVAVAALLIGLGGPLLPLLALLIGALPAGAYFLAGEKPGEAAGPLLFGWAVAGAAAAGMTGGLGGPLAFWCGLPLLASMVLPGGRAEMGFGLSFLATALIALLQYAGSLPPVTQGLAAALVGGFGLLAVVLAGGRAVVNLMKRAKEAEAERALMARFASELPCLALAVDRRGVIEAAYGSGLPGLGEQALDAGLIGAALADDRAALQASLNEAMEKGSAETSFRPAGAPATPLLLSLRRSGEESLSGIVLPSRSALADADGDARLKAALEERDAALATASARARFLANMSHELRTPLNAIMGFSDIMRSRLFGELSQRYGDYAELIHESGRHLLDLINDVLDMSKIEADRYELAIEEFDVREPVSAALRLVRLQADEAGVALRGVLPNDELLVEADRRALKQTVLNLVSNALKFTPRGGQVTVSVAPADGRFIELTVADTGVGIAPDDLLRLGKPYEQAGAADHRAQGTGLGLSLVKALAKLHGGSMAIESQIGEGAAVTVRLPVLKEVEAPTLPLPFDAQPQAEAAVEPAPAAGTDAAEPTVTITDPEAKPEPQDSPQPAQTTETRSGAEVISLNLLRPNFGGAGGGGGPNVA